MSDRPTAKLSRDAMRSNRDKTDRVLDSRRAHHKYDIHYVTVNAARCHDMAGAARRGKRPRYLRGP